MNNIVLKKARPGKIFIGQLTSTDTINLKDHCLKEVLYRYKSNELPIKINNVI